MGEGKYITGRGSSGFTRGAMDTMLVSERTFFPVTPTSLSFFSFLIEAPCLPPSVDLFWSKNFQNVLGLNPEIKKHIYKTNAQDILTGHK